MSTLNHGVKLASVEIEENDYVLTIERPDGSLVKILLPREGEAGGACGQSVIGNQDEPCGLNLVSSGHYW